jgi:SAM-dependent methyltransferase
MKDNNFWISDEDTRKSQKNNPKAQINFNKTFEIIDSIGGLKGDVLDIGSRNLLTEMLEERYKINIDSTFGDLDLQFKCFKQKYDFIHYNNVIEHQFNPLYTLLEIGKHLKKGGILILGTPLKPNWITFAKCHFHEFNKYQYNKLIVRSGFMKIKEMHYYKQFSIKGVRLFFASFYKRQVLNILMLK